MLTEAAHRPFERRCSGRSIHRNKPVEVLARMLQLQGTMSGIDIQPVPLEICG
jgi:hypothetical protein